MKKIVVVSQDPLLTNLADRLLSPYFRTIILAEMVSAIDSIYNDIPSLVIADIAPADDATVESINNLKEDPMFNGSRSWPSSEIARPSRNGKTCLSRIISGRAISNATCSPAYSWLSAVPRGSWRSIP